MMSSHLAFPREGHLEAVFHMFAYLKNNHNSEMVFNPSEPDIDMSDFPREDLSLSIYGDVREDIPPTCPCAESGPADMPALRGIDGNYRVITVISGRTYHQRVDFPNQVLKTCLHLWV